MNDGEYIDPGIGSLESNGGGPERVGSIVIGPVAIALAIVYAAAIYDVAVLVNYGGAVTVAVAAAAVNWTVAKTY